MAAIRDVVHRVPWTRQPQFPVGIDWGNPITKGLQFAVVPFSRLTEAANNGVLTYDTGATYLNDPVVGRGLFFNGSTDGISLPASPAGAYTVFGLVNINVLNATRNVMSMGSGTAYAMQLRADSGNWSYYQYNAASGGTDILAGENGTVVAGQITAIAGTWDGLTTISLYRGGVQRATALAPTLRAIASARVGQDNFGAKQTWSGSIYIAMMWARALSPAEHASLAANPWQVFLGQSRRIWTPGPVSVPTLSASTFKPATLTSTGWTPRVTAT